MKSRTKSTILGVGIILLSCSGAISLTAHNSRETEYVYVAPATPAVSQDPYMARTVECKEFDNKVQPCHRLSKGRWELVLSFSPMKSVRLSVCDVEDGGKKLPCIWQDTNKKDKKSDPTTRNVFWKGKLG